MTRQPQDFDGIGNGSTIWKWISGEDHPIPTEVSLIFEGSSGLWMDIEIGAGYDETRGHSAEIPLESIQELAEQLNAYLAWRRGCTHNKFVRTDRCNEMSCWNYASRRPVSDVAAG